LIFGEERKKERKKERMSEEGEKRGPGIRAEFLENIEDLVFDRQRGRLAPDDFGAGVEKMRAQNEAALREVCAAYALKNLEIMESDPPEHRGNWRKNFAVMGQFMPGSTAEDGGWGCAVVPWDELARRSLIPEAQYARWLRACAKYDAKMPWLAALAESQTLRAMMTEMDRDAGQAASKPGAPPRL